MGWTVGRNVQVEYRWEAVGAELKRKYAAELVALVPDVILTTGDSITGVMDRSSYEGLDRPTTPPPSQVATGEHRTSIVQK